MACRDRMAEEVGRRMVRHSLWRGRGRGWLYVLMSMIGVGLLCKVANGLPVSQRARTSTDELNSEIRWRTEGNRIINGDFVGDISEAPYVVSLFHSKKRGEKSLACTAVLIQPRLILTAAHCVTDVDIDASIELCVGTTDLLDDSVPYDCQEATEQRVAPDWNEYSLGDGNDLALLVVERNFDSPKVVPIAVSFTEVAPGTEADAIGFGDYTRDWNYDWRMRVMATHIVASPDCTAVASSSIDGNKFICADGNRSGRYGAVCYGDSGGPLVVRGATPADDYLIGVLSFGLTDPSTRKCRTDTEGGFTRLSFRDYSTFLKSTAVQLGFTLDVVGDNGPGSGPGNGNGDGDVNPADENDSNPIEPGGRGRGYVDFEPRHTGKDCKVVKVEGANETTAIQLTQEHITELPLRDIEGTISWVESIVDGDVTICIRAIHPGQEFNSKVRVWYLKPTILLRKCESSDDNEECEKSFRSTSIPVRDSKCSGAISPLGSEETLRRDVLITTATGERLPAVSNYRVENQSMARVCLDQPRLSDTTRNVNVLQMKSYGNLFKIGKSVAWTAAFETRCVIVPLDDPSDSNHILIGASVKPKSQGVSLFLVMREFNKFICHMPIRRMGKSQRLYLNYAQIQM